jgi:chemotaxis protein CheX
MTTIEPERIARAIAGATRDVFQTMLGIDAIPGEAKEEALDAPRHDGIAALVGVAGQWSGTGWLCCSAAAACRLAGAMLGAEYSGVNEEVLDAIAEVANMIIGNVKTSFEPELGALALSIPMVVFGRNYQTHSSGMPLGTVVPFTCGPDTIEVRFCLVQSPVRTKPRVPAVLV